MWGKMNAKTIKLLCIFETLVPRRDIELQKLEYSEVISKEITERINQLTVEEKKDLEPT